MNMNGRKRNRLQYYNYSENGYYYITICTKDMRRWFGEIVNGERVLNNLEAIANQCRAEISNHFENMHLEEFVRIIFKIILQSGDGINTTRKYDMLVRSIPYVEPWSTIG